MTAERHVRFKYFEDLGRAELARQHLLMEGVECALRHVGGSILGVPENTVELWGPPQLQERAVALLDDLESGDDASGWVCARCGRDNGLDASTCPSCGDSAANGQPTEREEPMWRCSGCGESVPDSFEVCWKCERPRTDERADKQRLGELMSWRSGGKLFAEIWPAILANIPDREHRLEFTAKLLAVFVEDDMDPYDIEDLHPDVLEALARAGLNADDP